MQEMFQAFGKRTNGVLAQPKLDAWKWVRFVELMPRKSSLEKRALECGVDAPAIHFMIFGTCA